MHFLAASSVRSIYFIMGTQSAFLVVPNKQSQGFIDRGQCKMKLEICRTKTYLFASYNAEVEKTF